MSKQSCGDMFLIEKMIRDSIGGIVNFQIVGTDPLVGVVDGSGIAVNYTPAQLNADLTFQICIEVVGVFNVTLADGSAFVITAVQSTAYLGKWYPAKLLSVNVGTTGDFSVGY